MTLYGKRIPMKKLTEKDRVALREHAARARRALKSRGCKFFNGFALGRLSTGPKRGKTARNARRQEAFEIMPRLLIF
jgi:hypothetical protein